MSAGEAWFGRPQEGRGVGLAGVEGRGGSRSSGERPCPKPRRLDAYPRPPTLRRRPGQGSFPQVVGSCLRDGVLPGRGPPGGGGGRPSTTLTKLAIPPGMSDMKVCFGCFQKGRGVGAAQGETRGSYSGVWGTPLSAPPSVAPYIRQVHPKARTRPPLALSHPPVGPVWFPGPPVPLSLLPTSQSTSPSSSSLQHYPRVDRDGASSPSA